MNAISNSIDMLRVYDEFESSEKKFKEKIKHLLNVTLLTFIVEASTYKGSVLRSTFIECVCLELKRRFDIREQKANEPKMDLIDKVCQVAYKAAANDIVQHFGAYQSDRPVSEIVDKCLDLMNDSKIMSWERIEELSKH